MRFSISEVDDVITMKEVALKANVSKATVSYVVNGTKNISENIRNNVLAAIKELDYKPNKTAQSLARNSTNCIGLFGSDLNTLKSHVFFNELMAGVLSVTTEYNYNLIIFPEIKNDNGEFCITLDHGDPIDGAIIINPRVSNSYLQKIIDRNLSFVLIGRPSEYHDQINYVDSDNVASGYHVTKHLISLNHSKILLLNGPQNYTLSIDRLEGYKLALLDYKIPFVPEYVINSEFTIPDSMEAIKKVLQSSTEFTAIICTSDTQAVGTINILNEFNYKIPKDVSIICGGDTYLTANYNPKITAVDLNGVEIGYQAAKHLMSMLEKKLIKPSHKIIPFEIRLRDTTTYAKTNGI